MIMLQKRQRILSPSDSAPSQAKNVQHGSGIFDRIADHEIGQGTERAGVFGRQGSVNEIRLQIPLHNTGIEHISVGRDGVNNKPVSPLMFLATKNKKDGKRLDTSGKVISQNELQVRKQERKWTASFINMKDRLTSGGHLTTENSSGGSLKAIREYHKNKKITRNHKCVMAIISSILVVFTIGWCPYMVALFLYAVCDNHCAINATILSGLLNLCVLQSFANFFVYFVKDATFKSRVKQIFRFGKDLGFTNRVAAVKSADQGMFGVAFGNRKAPGVGGGVGTGTGRKRVQNKERKSDPNRLQLLSIS